MTTRRDFLKLSVGGVAMAAASPLLAQTNEAAATSPPPTSASPGGLHIAMLQMTSHGHDREANGAKAEQWCRWARERGADIALMPEMFSIGYHPFHGTDPGDIAAWQSLAVPSDGEWVGRFRRLAKELDMAIGVAYLEAWPGAPRNSLTLIDRHGEVAFTYAKIHTCDFAAFEFVTTPGERVHVVDLDTARGPVRVGAMICFDREFPETARLNMLQGAELVLTPNACLLDDLRISQYRVRALENSMALAMTNYPDGFNNGRSVAVDAAGGVLAGANGSEQILSAVLDIDNLRAYRATTIWGDAYRRPHRYEALAANEPTAAPWQRTTPLGGAYDRRTR